MDEGFDWNAAVDKGFAISLRQGRVKDHQVDIGSDRTFTSYQGACHKGAVRVGEAVREQADGALKNFVSRRDLTHH